MAILGKGSKSGFNMALGNPLGPVLKQGTPDYNTVMESNQAWQNSTSIMEYLL